MPSPPTTWQPWTNAKGIAVRGEANTQQNKALKWPNRRPGLFTQLTLSEYSASLWNGRSGREKNLMSKLHKSTQVKEVPFEKSVPSLPVHTQNPNKGVSDPKSNKCLKLKTSSQEKKTSGNSPTHPLLVPEPGERSRVRDLSIALCLCSP